MNKDCRTRIIICGSSLAVENWIVRLRRAGYNYFVPYKDTRGPALQFGWVSWTKGFYICPD